MEEEFNSLLTDLSPGVYTDLFLDKENKTATIVLDGSFYLSDLRRIVEVMEKAEARMNNAKS